MGFALLALNRHVLDKPAVEETLGCIFKYREDMERVREDLDLVLKDGFCSGGL